MKMKLMFAVLTLGLMACGQDPTSSSPTPVGNVNAKWVSSYNTFDFSQVALNTESNADLVVLCDGSYGNSGQVNGVSEGNVTITGTSSQGLVQFGHLKYVGASNSLCRDYTKEGYQYQVSADGNTMTLTMVNYPTIVITYTKE
jgi:hypothetical protein